MGALVLLLASQFQAQAQTVTVTGRVTDEKGLSVPGATVNEKKTKNATTTREDGSFTLMVHSGAILVISYVGYEHKEVPAGENMTIALAPDTKALADVVVTGVGVATSKKKVAIDVATVSPKDFAKSATTSIDQALDGQIAGAQIQQQSGRAGANYLITLRGINSLDNTNPLIMVDGVQFNNLAVLDPANIDHIEVVKGAAGGMLYGAQGANGVIQVFTKKGLLNNRLSISFSSKASVDNILRGKTILSQLHYFNTDANGNVLDNTAKPISMNAQGIWTDPVAPNPSTTPDAVLNKHYNLPLYDHLKQAYRQAMTFSNTISMTGGNANTDYALTASLLNQQDVQSNALTRSNIGLNLGIQPFKGFTFRTITQVIVSNNNLTNGDRFGVITAYPYVDYTWKDSTGHYPFKTSTASNSMNTLSENQWHSLNSTTIEIFQNFNFNYKFPRFVELDFKYGLDYDLIDRTSFYKNQSAALQPSLHWGPDRLGDITNTHDRFYNVNALSSFFFRTDFQKDFHLNIPLRTTTQVSYDYRDNAEREYFAEGTQLPPYPPSSISSATVKNDGDFYAESATFGFLANQTFDYGDLMGISVGVRSDYGSPFGAAYKAATFPRGTIYFHPTELIGQHDWLSDWKLRAAYGEAGIQPRAYDRQITLSQVTLGNSVSLSLTPQATNDSLKLLISKELEVGTDLVFTPFHGNWADRIAVGATYWTRHSDGIYQFASVAPSTGYGSRLDNLSTIYSHGLDLNLDAAMYHSSNVVWNMSVRWGFTKSVLTRIANGQDIIQGEFAAKQGKEVGLFYSQTPLHSITQLQVDGKTPYISPANQQFYTIVRGTVVDTRTNSVVLTAGNDLSVVGHAYPDFTSSLINTITLFNSLTVSFQFDWTHGNNIYNETKQWLYRPAGGSGGYGGISKDLETPITIGTKTGAFVNWYQTLYNVGTPDSWFVEDGSFIRLKDLSISYDLKKLVKTNSIKRLSATISGRNLLTFTKYSGLDPENTGSFDTQGNSLSDTRAGAFTGVDYFGIPNLRSYQFSVNIGF
jgi:TonB-linked SusC/RagA family outer membrane protein